MKRYPVLSSRRFGYSHPHYINRVTGFRGGIRL